MAVSYNQKEIRFAMMNVLIKGTAASIQSALSRLDSQAYELEEFTYNPKKVDPDDASILKAGLVFERWYEGFITPNEIPFANMSDIKFIGLGNGGDNIRSDGSYVFYKDFGETQISECYQFSSSNPHEEEFDAQWQVLEDVRNSFMDHTWQYRYLLYSCGEYGLWAFNGKKDKELIRKWKSDEQGDLKKEAKQVTIGGMDDIAFSYEHIDGISPAFYDGVYNGKEFIVNPDGTVELDINGKNYIVTIKTKRKVNAYLKTLKNAVSGENVGRSLYNPADVASGKYGLCGTNEYGQSIYGVSDDAELLENSQIAHRASLFVKVNNLLKDKNVMTMIIEAVPKKKNGTFALKRVTQIATLFCMEEDTSMYTLCAVAKKDTELLIEVRQIASVDLQKTYDDVITKFNLFR